MEAAFVFGTVGNLSGRLVVGWSIEDQYAWATGDISVLVLPLPADAEEYVLRFTVHPLIYPGVRDTQRLTVYSGERRLGDYELTRRGSIEVPLPLDLTNGQDAIQLTLNHPDWIKPSDVRPVDDSRPLAICFHAASLARAGDHGTSGHAGGPSPPTNHAIVAGAVTARQVSRIVGTLPSFRKTAVHYFDLDQPVDNFVERESAEAISGARFCWIQADFGRGINHDALRARLPADCEVRVFPTPRFNALWPFQGNDPRAVPEPGRYSPARYPFTDRIAASLAPLNMPDDVLFLMYESMSEKEMPDMEAMVAADIGRLEKAEANCDVKLSPFIRRHFRHKRLFLAPVVPARALVRELVDRLLDSPAVGRLTNNAALGGELDSLLEGYIGRREEVPIHPLIAQRLQLAWWNADLSYRWFNNRRSYKEYIVNYIRWLQWRP